MEATTRQSGGVLLEFLRMEKKNLAAFVEAMLIKCSGGVAVQSRGGTNKALRGPC